MQCLIDQLVEDVKHVRPAVEKTRPNVTKNPDVDRLEEDVNRMSKRWGNCCMQVVERLRSCEAACELLEKYNMSYQTETNWMDELDSKLRNLEELEAARAKEAWEKHVVSTFSPLSITPRSRGTNATKQNPPNITLMRVNKPAGNASFVTYKWLHQIIHFCGLRIDDSKRVE